MLIFERKQTVNRNLKSQPRELNGIVHPLILSIGSLGRHIPKKNFVDTTGAQIYHCQCGTLEIMSVGFIIHQKTFLSCQQFVLFEE